MNKDLTPLEALERYGYHCNHYVNGEKDYKIIEFALKELDFYKKRAKQWKQDVNKNINKLKALEIIKKYIPYYIEIETDENGKFIMTDHEHLVQDELTQEEYDLLNEVLL